MAERASALERVQIAAEATAGVAVGAATRLLMTHITPQPVVPVMRHRGAGRLFNSAAVVGYERTEAALEGAAGYNDLVPLLAAHLKAAAFTGNAARFTPAVDTANTIKTLSVEVGQAERAEKFNYGVVRDLGLRFTRSEVSLSGALFGRTLTEGASLTSVTATLNPVPIGPASWEVYLGTSADLSDLALLTRVLECEWRSNGRWRPLDVANATLGTWTAPVELAPDMQFRLVVEHDAAGSGHMALLRAATARYFRIRSIGPGGTAAYMLTIDAPVQIVDAVRNVTDDVAATEYTLEPLVRSGFVSGAALDVQVVSDHTAW